MTKRQLASAIALLEGRKSQSRIGDIREILFLLEKLDVKYVLENGAEGSPISILMESSAKKIARVKGKKDR